jgi:hypothetical protein
MNVALKRASTGLIGKHPTPVEVRDASVEGQESLTKETSI